MSGVSRTSIDLPRELLPDVLNVLDRMERLLRASSDPFDFDYSDFVIGLRHRLTHAAPTSQLYTTGLLRAIVDTAPAGIIVIDPHGRIERFNAAAERIFGYAASEVVGRDVSQLMPAGVTEEHAAHVGRFLARHGSPDNARPRLVLARRKDGQTFPLEVELGELQTGDAGFVMGIVRDVTDRQRAVAELQSECELVRAATETKSRLLAFASHEIRTPITAIIGFAEELLESDLSEFERQSALRTIRHGGKQLLEMVNDILDLSKLEAGLLSVERAECAPSAVISSVESLMQVLARNKGLALTIEYSGAIPQTIQTDATRLRQILVNVIGNAIKFTSQGGVHVRVCVADPPGQTASRLRLEISDTGIGMNEAELSTVFEPFRQADLSIARRFGGTGLGLAVSRHLVEMLGGTMDVKSKPGRGTTFTITIDAGPLEGVPMVDCPTSLAVAPDEGGDHSASGWRNLLAGRRILLAEDHDDNRRLIAHILKRGGAELVEARDGREAVEQAGAADAAGRTFDVVLMDMRMPVMDGYEAARQLRAAGYRGSIIALTADAMTGDREQCVRAGCDEYLTKPIDRNRLVETVVRLVGPAGSKTMANRMASSEVGHEKNPAR